MKFIKILIVFIVSFVVLYKVSSGSAYIGAMIFASAYGAYEYSK